VVRQRFDPVGHVNRRPVVVHGPPFRGRCAIAFRRRGKAFEPVEKVNRYDHTDLGVTLNKQRCHTASVMPHVVLHDHTGYLVLDQLQHL